MTPIAILFSTPFKRFLREKVLLGNAPSWELLAILSIYFVQGVLGLSRLAVSFFLKDELGLSPAAMGALIGLGAAPWIIKPVLGLLSDTVPLFGYRRRSYLWLSGLMGSVGWLLFAGWVGSGTQAGLVLLFTSLSVAIGDVIVDSLVVERAQRESLAQVGSLQSLTWGAAAVGGIITAYASGALLEWFSTRTVFAITAIFPLLTVGAAFLISEASVGEEDSKPEPRAQIKLVWQAVRQKTILLPTLFIFFWQATPSAESAFFYFTTNELGFEPEFLGRVRLVTSVAGLIGVGLYQRFLKTVPFRVIMGWSTVISSALGLTTLILITHANRAIGIDDHWFSLGDSIILTVTGQIAFMPVLVLAARLCPPGIEATLFALLMSVMNLAGVLSFEVGSLLTHWLGVTETQFDNLALLVIITNLSTLLPLPFLGLLPAGDPQENQATEAPDNPGDHLVLPPAEVFEHHTVGSLSDQNFLPEFVSEKSSSRS
ncbi:folate/biopterin family MFS transporter [Synechocystis sp. PCC 7339]|uniref:folate/biopterin family MFS transporter n=1 Tax=unclassified Synechocystis TaxID=2640012 RepID=UPI001BB06B01|nr:MULTISPECIES: folate/biopterin family MFS transporter [unclassified Synechocystis]QUS62065.1 folate/biopterin family MFS transporter [Synechocystis sp. PCC 7338]UAJ74266.1 folate/biopterin family MFS transporter [Synechocystis sp. PCC 7339]